MNTVDDEDEDTMDSGEFDPPDFPPWTQMELDLGDPEPEPDVMTATYITHGPPDWNREDTKMVSGPYGYEGEEPYRRKRITPGQWFTSREEARAYWKHRAGRILEEFQVVGRYFFRVRRDA